MDNQQPSCQYLIILVKGSTTIPVKGSRTQAIGVRSGAPHYVGDDIVCARVERPRGYNPGTEVAFCILFSKITNEKR
jgi:hypothetical protein